MTDSDATGAGEIAANRKRKAFWNALGVIAVGGALVGAFFGFYFAASRHRPTGAGLLNAMPDGLLIALCAVGLFAFVWGTWKFVSTIDEVELGDNLWGSTVAYYFYGLAFPLWWVLAEKRLLPPVDGWTLYLTALFAGCLAYGWRKWRAR